MSSPKSSLLQPLLETPSVQLYQCQYTYPLAPTIIRKARDYLQEHPANHAPLDHKLPYLSEAMQETLVEIDQRDSEFERLREVVRQMEEQRESLAEIAFRLGGMVKTMICRLSPQLLFRIFFMARDEGNEDRSPCRVPLTLSHVCSHWRALVHSEPGLWCIIEANFHVVDDQVSANRLREFTKFCLERSRPKPINVTLMMPDDLDRSDEYKEDYAEALDQLLVNSCRWKFASFLLHPHDEERFADHNIDFPMLERLDMCCRRDEWGPCDAIILTPSAPRLSDMYLRGVERKYFKLINLDALSELTMENYHIDGFFHILQYSPNLSYVTLKGYNCSPYQESNFHVTSQIRCLHAELQSGGHDIFEQLSLPSLTMLRVWCCQDPPPRLHQFMSRSRPPLTHLHLSGAGRHGYIGLVADDHTSQAH
ncbi:hypothetical protein Moror_10990 [Moniliophthora roreri MCA 2997]|uniref:F-box domain-containing protein n=1 Tax=Moniliophthora roreri (strain MCA 2997) TaxID=1381753 RepID=V2WYX3_MONRO|nr:hypothetical protein Moror_10990 [Moniliophthora roreri MCA 2997]